MENKKILPVYQRINDVNKFVDEYFGENVHLKPLHERIYIKGLDEKVPGSKKTWNKNDDGELNTAMRHTYNKEHYVDPKKLGADGLAMLYNIT